MSTLFGVPVDAAYHLVFALTSVLTPVLGPVAAVAGIIVITIAVRLLVSPLTFRALRGQAAQARLAPEIQRLRQRYGKQPDRLQRELTALYQHEGTSMFAGFAPLLAQWPVFSVLYLLFRSPTVGGVPNLLLSRDLLGVPLGSHWLSGAGILSVHGIVFLSVLAVLAAACWCAARVARRALPQPAPAGPARPARPGRRGTAGSAPADTLPGSRALTTVGKIAPYLTVLIAAFAPLAGVIYLVTSTGWSAAERLVFAARAKAGRAAAAARPLASGLVATDSFPPIRRLEPGDLRRCVALSVDRGWLPERSKWSLLLAASETFGVDAPDGRGLAGAVVLTRWGPDLASVGMMLVAARYGRRGLGRALMEHVIAEAGGATVTLFATDMGRPLYEKLGFQPVRRNVSFVGAFRPAGRRQPGGRAGRMRASGDRSGPAGDARRRPCGIRRGPRPHPHPAARLRRPNRRPRGPLPTPDHPHPPFAATRRPGGIPRRPPSSARWSPPTLRRPSSSLPTWPRTRTAPSAWISTPIAPNSPPGPTGTASSRSAGPW